MHTSSVSRVRKLVVTNTRTRQHTYTYTPMYLLLTNTSSAGSSQCGIAGNSGSYCFPHDFEFWRKAHRHIRTHTHTHMQTCLRFILLKKPDSNLACPFNKPFCFITCLHHVYRQNLLILYFKVGKFRLCDSQLNFHWNCSTDSFQIRTIAALRRPARFAFSFYESIVWKITRIRLWHSQTNFYLNSINRLIEVEQFHPWANHLFFFCHSINDSFEK